MEKENDVVVQDKVVNILSFREVRDKHQAPISMEQYAQKPQASVKRGELLDIFIQVLGNIDTELTDSFERAVRTANLSEVIVQALVNKGLITMDDIKEAQKTLIDESTKKEEKGDGQQE